MPQGTVTCHLICQMLLMVYLWTHIVPKTLSFKEDLWEVEMLCKYLLPFIDQFHIICTDPRKLMATTVKSYAHKTCPSQLCCWFISTGYALDFNLDWRVNVAKTRVPGLYIIAIRFHHLSWQRWSWGHETKNGCMAQTHETWWTCKFKQHCTINQWIQLNVLDQLVYLFIHFFLSLSMHACMR